MKIKSLQLNRFRQFFQTDIQFGNFNILVGPNNAGKTTVLHAIRAFFSLMNGQVRFEGSPPKPVFHRRYLTNVEDLIPTPDHRELWYKKQAGSHCKISLTFEDEQKFTVLLRQQFGQVHVATEELPAFKQPADYDKYIERSVAFIPGLVGVLVDEPFASFARRNSLASQGRYSEIFRSSLHQLHDRDNTRLQKLNDVLLELFGVSVSRVAFDPEADEYVTVEYVRDDTNLDIVSAGSGLQQLVQILTYIYLTSPQILLIDEPDAHLHSQLQGRLGALLRQIASDLDAQVFICTHSLDLIDTAGPEEVIVVEAKRKTIRPLAANADIVSAMASAGIVDNSSLSRIIASRRMVVLEDKNTALFKVIDRLTGAGLFTFASGAFVKSALGQSNFPQYKELADILTGFTDRPVELTFIHDRDGLPDFLADLFLSSMAEKDMDVHLLGRHELESYLIDPELVSDALRNKITSENAKKMIIDSGKKLLQEARQRCRKSAKEVNRHLKGDKKFKEDALELDSDKWFDGLDSSNWEVIARVWPGKELVNELRSRIKNEFDLELRPGQLAASLKASHLPHELKDFWIGLAPRHQLSPTKQNNTKKTKKAIRKKVTTKSSNTSARIKARKSPVKKKSS